MREREREGKKERERVDGGVATSKNLLGAATNKEGPSHSSGPAERRNIC